MIKAYNNSFNGTYYFIPYGGSYSGATTTTDFDAYVVSSKSTTVPSSVKSASGSNTYNNFDTSSIMYSYTADSPTAAMANVKKYAGRIEGGDFAYTFSDSADSSYDVDTTLKSKLENYSGATTAYNTSTGSTTETGSGSDTGSTGSDTGSNSGSDTGSSTETNTGSTTGGATSSSTAVSLKAESLSTGTLTSNTAYDSFTVLASSSKTVKIVSSSCTWNSNTYTKAFDLGGGADGVKPTYRAIKFTAAAGASISVVANAGSTRTLNLSDGSSVLKSVSVGTSAAGLNYTTTKAGTYYLYSSSSSIRIFEVYVSGAAAASFSTIEMNANNLSHGTFTANTTSGKFTIYATSAKTVSVPYITSTTYGGTTYTQTLALGGGGSAGSYRCVGFSAVSGCTVTAYAYGAAGRYLALVDSTGAVVSKKEVSSSVASYTFSVPSDGNYYLMSTASGINLCYVKVSK